jgi:hypothetical protein
MGCCGNGAKAATEAPGVEEEKAENGDDIPPAPVVDPSAFLPTTRVIKASAFR